MSELTLQTKSLSKTHLPLETVRLEVFAPKTMDENRFQILSELAAEMWQHAARRWGARSAAVFALPAGSTTAAEQRTALSAEHS